MSTLSILKFLFNLATPVWHRYRIVSLGLAIFALLFVFVSPARAVLVPEHELNPVFETSLKRAKLLSAPYTCRLQPATRGIIPGSSDPRLRWIVDVPGPGWKKVKTSDQSHWKLIDANTAQVFICDPATIDRLRLSEKESDPTGFGWILTAIRWVLSFLALLIAKIGLWVVNVAGHIIGFSLSFNQFVTHRYVVVGWPFVQGVANLGFILALLFIAFATTLRLETWGARRMLPRLFAAVLFINFSLVISGAIIDASRVIMAGFIRIIVGPGISLDGIGLEILRNSSLLKLLYSISTAKKEIGFVEGIDTSANWNMVLFAWLGAISTWIVAVALLVIALALLWRYLMLLLLLIVSPLAYLALALPAMDGLARKWWDNFLRWVIFGPVLVFILALLMAVGTAPFRLSQRHIAIEGIFDIIVTAVFSFIAVTAGRHLGAIGSGAMMSTFSRAKGTAQRYWKPLAAGTAGFALGGPVGAAAAAGGLGTRGGRAVLGGTARLGYAGLERIPGVGRLFKGIRQAPAAIKRPFVAYGETKKKLEEAEEREKRKRSVGTRFARYLAEPAEKRREAQQKANDIRANNQPTSADIGRISAADLSNARVAQELNEVEIRSLVVNVMQHGNTGQQLSVLNSIEVVKNLNAATEKVVFDSGNTDLIKALLRTQQRIREAEEKAGGAPPPPKAP